MDSLQVIAILTIILVHFVFLYFISNKFGKSWLKDFFIRVNEWEKGTDMGLTTVRIFIIIETVIAFVIVKGL